MTAGRRDRKRRSFKRWFHDTFDDMGFRALIGPAQTRNAVQGCDQSAREQWKHDLENRRRYSREQRERKRRAHQEHHSQ